jgi:hypothetical protein
MEWHSTIVTTYELSKFYVNMIMHNYDFRWLGETRRVLVSQQPGQQFILLHQSRTWGTMRDGQACHILPPTTSTVDYEVQMLIPCIPKHHAHV